MTSPLSPRKVETETSMYTGEPSLWYASHSARKLPVPASSLRASASCSSLSSIVTAFHRRAPSASSSL